MGRTSARKQSSQPVDTQREQPRDQAPDYDDRNSPRGRGRGIGSIKLALGEGRSKGWGAERRSDRVFHLGHDVGSCHDVGVDLRVGPTDSACRMGKEPSSMLIHPLGEAGSL